jgi:transposase
MTQAVLKDGFEEATALLGGSADSAETKPRRCAEPQHRDREVRDPHAKADGKVGYGPASHPAERATAERDQLREALERAEQRTKDEHDRAVYWEAQYTRVAAELEQRNAELERLRAKVEGLEQEVRDARQQAGYWQAQHQRAIDRFEKLKTELQQAQAQIRELKQQVFGRSSERRKERGSRNVPGEDKEKPQRNRGGQPGHKPNGRRDYSNLPKEEGYVDVPEDQKTCPHCGLPLLLMTDTADWQQIEIHVRSYVRVLHRRRYRRICTCPGPKTITAPCPPKLIPKGLYGTTVWVEILLDKYGSHRPTARLLGDWEHAGLSLPASTVTSGMQHLEQPLNLAYKALLKHNAEGDLHQADESRWPVFSQKNEEQDKAPRPQWLWAFSSPDSVVFRIDPRHSHHVPEEHFASSPPGTLVVDRAKIYAAMKQVKEGKLRLAFCWAHARRDFVKTARSWPKLESWALEWLKRIRELYRINRQRRKCEPGSAEFQQQQRALQAAIESFRAEFTKALEDPKLHPACQKVMKSLQKHWPGLVRFVKDPRIPMDNNREERVIRGPVLGRKNYYGSGAPWAARLAAEMFSILGTLELWRINPRLWLQWYLESYAAAGRPKAFDPEPFLPWNLSEERLAELRGEPNPTPPPASDSS